MPDANEDIVGVKFWDESGRELIVTRTSNFSPQYVYVEQIAGSYVSVRQAGQVRAMVAAELAAD